MKKIIFFLLIALSLSITSCNEKTTHQCNWEDCEHNGEIMSPEYFTSYWGYDNYTDGYNVELTHYMNPNWTYEQCEDYIFNKSKNTRK